MEALQAAREEIVTNLTAVERPESLQRELIEEVQSIDRELGAYALFQVSPEAYHIPEVHPQEDALPPVMQHETLF